MGVGKNRHISVTFLYQESRINTVLVRVVKKDATSSRRERKCSIRASSRDSMNWKVNIDEHCNVAEYYF